MLTNKQLEEIRKRADNATKGPWFNESPSTGVSAARVPKDAIIAYPTWEDCHIADVPYQKGSYQLNKKQNWNNFNFIAKSRDDVPNLLDMVEELQAENENLKKELDRLWDKCEIVLHHFPHYPIEHNPHAKKDGRALIETKLKELE